jgi:hypothetical protein
MIHDHGLPASRQPKTVQHRVDLVVVGGGMAGVCAAITAARAGLRVVLATDRPVLGGNASSEVRLWVLGATAHGFTANRWAREGGVIDEIQVENWWRNPQGNPVVFDSVVLEWVARETNITLLLNTSVYEVDRAGDAIQSVTGYCSQNGTRYVMSAPVFVDASGDGVVGFLAGAAFRMGAETREEFGEKFAPDESYGHLLGHTIYFYSKDTGKPVKFTAPAFAIPWKDIPARIPRFRQFDAKSFGCQLWWLEHGGRMDTVHDSEKIKWELWQVVYGAWDYIKNSGQFPEAETLTLEWVGAIPGKRESRRFEGDYMLRQQDIIDRNRHDDDVAYGGWSIDLHPADGVFGNRPGCNQYHARGVYGIPYRCLYSKNISNLFLAGRIISSSHVAFGSTRVIATCSHAAQAVGMAAMHCVTKNLRPRDLLAKGHMEALRLDLYRTAHGIAGATFRDPDDLTHTATITASSELQLSTLPADAPATPVGKSIAQMLPVKAGRVPVVTVKLNVTQPTEARFELRRADRADEFAPSVVMASLTRKLEAGDDQSVALDFGASVDDERYVFVCLMKNADIAVHRTKQRITGLLSVEHQTWLDQRGKDVGCDEFDIWYPQRRPGGHNIACAIDPPIRAYAPINIRNGVQRPRTGPNAWAASMDDSDPTLKLSWDVPQTIGRVEVIFDGDFEHPTETVLKGHPDNASPFCVAEAQLVDEQGRVLAETHDQHHARWTIKLAAPITTRELSLRCLRTQGGPGVSPAAVFEVRCYAK